MAEPVISVNGITMRLGGQLILKKLDLQVSVGEKIVLLGPSGCGKSTLLRCINGLERVQEGTLSVLGENLTKPKTSLTALRARVGMVFQQYNLFPHLTVLDNIILAPIQVKGIARPQAIEQAHALLERVGIPEKATVYPDQLSGGQQQRVAIARCLAMAPEIMLLDEPTSALDPLMTREVFSVIEDVASQEGMTLLIVTHDMRFARRVATRIAFMAEGQVQEEGPPEQLLEHPQQERTRLFLDTLL